MNALKVLCLSLCAALLPGVAAADTLTHEAAEVEVDVPDGWTSKSDEEGLTVGSPDEAVQILFMILEADELDAALTEVDKEVGKVVARYRGKKPESGTIHGMSAVSIEGSGFIDDVPVEVALAVFVTPADKHLLVFGLAPTERYEASKKTIEGMLGSIRPVGSPIVEELIHEAGKVVIGVPKGWSHERDGEVLALESPHEAVGVLFFVLEESELEPAIDGLAKELDPIIKEPKLEDPTKAAFHGMGALLFDGSGKIDGVAVEIGMALIDTPASKILVVLGFVEAGKMKEHKASLDALVAGIRPAK